MGFTFEWEKKVNKQTSKIYGASDSDKHYGEKKAGKAASGVTGEELLLSIGLFGKTSL